MASWLIVEAIEPCNASRLDLVTASANRVTAASWRSTARCAFAAVSAAPSSRLRVRASMSVHVAATSAPTPMTMAAPTTHRWRRCPLRSATGGLRAGAARRDGIEGGDGAGSIIDGQLVQGLLDADQAALQGGDERGLLGHVRLRGGQRRLRPQELRAVLAQRRGVAADLCLEDAEATAELLQLRGDGARPLLRDVERGVRPPVLVACMDLVGQQRSQCHHEERASAEA